MNPSLRSKSFLKLHLLKEEILKISSDNIDIPFITIAETWPKPYVNDIQLYLENYTVYRADRAISKNGGVLVYVHNNIIIDSTFSYDDNICNAIVCLSKKSKVIIACIYRPPNLEDSSFSKLLNGVGSFIDRYNSLNKFHIFIFGDFNFPQICWKDISLSKNLTSGVQLLFDFPI